MQDIPDRVMRALEDAHGCRLSLEMAPRISRYASKRSRQNRREFYNALAGKDVAQRYQRFAEVALHEYLCKHYETVECPEYPADFYLKQQNCYIEVVTPQIGENSELKQFNLCPGEHPGIRDVPVDALVLKYWDSIERKSEDFSKKLNDDKIDSGAPIIIAVCPIIISEYSLAGSVPNDYEFPFIVRAVFPIGKGYFWIDRETKEEGTGISSQISVPSIRGVPREKTLFLKTENAHISATIAFSHDFNWFRDWNPIVVHNPLARNPVPVDFFPNSKAVYRATIDGKKYNLGMVS